MSTCHEKDIFNIKYKHLIFFLLNISERSQ